MSKKENNNRPYIIWGGIILLVIIFFSVFVGSYNKLVRFDETVDERWANVESAYQRRADLIPNLVSTVQGVVDFEKDTQTQIAAVRSNAVQASQAMKDASSPEEFQKAAQESEQALTAFRGLNINVEAYPELKSSENFLSLQDELAGTENRVKVERDLYNNAVKNYNVKVRAFPSNIIANMFGFDKEDGMFEADEGSDEAPEVKF